MIVQVTHLQDLEIENQEKLDIEEDREEVNLLYLEVAILLKEVVILDQKEKEVNLDIEVKVIMDKEEKITAQE